MQTFLFTDVEGSTRLWERYPAAMGAAIARQEGVLREAVASGGGTVFNTAGDGVCAVFATPQHAIDAALAGQRRLLAEPWETIAPGLRISVRMAVDAGNATAAGANFVGPVLNRLHRLMKTGHGGQILCTETVAAVLAEPAVRLRDLGSHPLRDIPGDTHLFQIVAEGIPAVFPPLVSDRPLPKRLPLPAVALFGREAAQEDIDALLRDRTARLVTLLGPGGVGKTSLALAAGQQLLDAFPDGVHFIDLSASTDGALVVSSIATALEIEDPLLTPEDALVARLQSRATLLILDNCEQVAEPVAAVVGRIIRETDGVSVLATSRVPLRVRSEHELLVEPLPLPAGHADPADNPAVRLFADQARQVSNRFTLNAASTPAVVEICRMVDGLPLAIELAAAWVRILDPATLRDRLADGAPMLRSDLRDRPERHRTLSSTIDWSYRLLSPQQQWAFGRLAVFQGGIPIDGALAVLQDGDGVDFVDALALLDALVQANLVRTPEQTADGPRYGMLQTIQEFGRYTLSSADRLAAHQAHAAVFAAMASAAEAHYRGPEAVTWLDRLDANIDNLRAAVDWLATGEGGDPEAALRMATELWEFFDVRNRQHIARGVLSTAIDAAPDGNPALLAQALAQLGNTWFSNYEQAETFFRRSLAVASQAPDEGWQMAATLGLGSIALLRGDFETSLSIAQQVLERSRASDDPAADAQALLMLGHVLEYFDRPRDALVPLEESLALSHQMGDVAGAAWSSRIQCLAYLALGDLERSETLCRQAIDAFESVGERIMVALCELELVRVLLRTSSVDTLAILERAVATLVPVADIFSANEAIYVGAAALLRVNEAPLALELLSAAEIWRVSTGTVLSTVVQDEVETTRARIVEDLGPAAVAAAIVRGRNHSLRDALELLHQRLLQLEPRTPEPQASSMKA